MTFSQSVKEELCHTKFHCSSCDFAFVYAVLLFFGDSSTHYFFRTDQKLLIDLLAEKIVEDTGVIVTVTDPDIHAGKKKKEYLLSVEDRRDFDTFCRRYHLPFEKFLQTGILKKECCRIAFFRGAFIACGVIVNPVREYHLEFKVSDHEVADEFEQVIHTYGGTLKRTRRKGNDIFYLKESEQIEDMLTYMGAVKCAMNMMDVKIVKEVRNNVNRVTNCETANIQKTVNASMKQVQDIQYIMECKHMKNLSDDLKETAQLRLSHPEYSLKELCELMPGISRSGLNHRLKKLSEIAEGLRRQQDGKE
jgi:DNA-binding protein WhiA